ncbi:MAG: hypothetical protein RL616_908, partial [Verrucomicrobiota bacterium]
DHQLGGQAKPVRQVGDEVEAKRVDVLRRRLREHEIAPPPLDDRACVVVGVTGRNRSVTLDECAALYPDESKKQVNEALNALSMDIRNGLLGAMERYADDSNVRSL